MNLEWKDVDFVPRAIVGRPKSFWKPKSRDERLIPMNDAVFFALFSREKKSRWIFCDKNGEKLKIHSLRTRFSRKLTRLGIPAENLHTWRHTFAGYIMMKSGNICAVQKLLGHRSIRTTEVYAHLSERHPHGVVRPWWSRFSPKSIEARKNCFEKLEEQEVEDQTNKETETNVPIAVCELCGSDNGPSDHKIFGYGPPEFHRCDKCGKPVCDSCSIPSTHGHHKYGLACRECYDDVGREDEREETNSGARR